ncbi:MAG: ATP-binding protein [Ectothiorhodospiraceae bacterium AqS1]|nr:ATP-binding protein [Ectothiorhodospiraceae bacterium AqS1]
MREMTVGSWHEVVHLRPDIEKEELSLKAFAADLHDVMLGQNRGVYHDPEEFFSLTYPTVKLRDLARDVTRRLAGGSEKAVRRLHITFGGGKTHSLITLVHLVSDPSSLPDIPSVREFKTHCDIEGGFPKARIAAVVFDRLDAEKGMEVKAPDGTLRTFKQPWSLLAWQLAGEAGLRLLKEDGSERSTPPATNVMESLFELARKEVPAILILFDEVLWFVRTMADQDPAWIPRMADFLHSLTQSITKVPQCCLVASLLASETDKMDEIGKRISKDIHDEFKRVADEGIQPVESHDIPEILRRQLFALESYTKRDRWSGQVMAALNGIQTIDENTKKNRSQEEKKYSDSYPFHPGLIELFYAKWTQLEGFQQTRGILKTLAVALRDASKWDRQPIVSAQVFLESPDSEGLCIAAKELADIAQLEEYDGRRQNWPAIIEAELGHARKAQEDLRSLDGREIEQSVVATFLHSQPIGQRAMTSELKPLIGGSAPDSIELDKGLSRWAENSWYLDDSFIDDQTGDLPKFWRLGSKPNLNQMHHDACRDIVSKYIDEVLDGELRKAKNLTEGARAAGVKSYLLPAQPSDIPDDGNFHYAILGDDAASESGNPSRIAKRFIDETTGPDRPRARNRNTVVLVVPSKDGLDAMRKKVCDYLGWNKVREMLEGRDDIDGVARVRLEAGERKSKSEMSAQIATAWCIAVTVNDANEVDAYRIAPGNESLFKRIMSNPALRIESTAINAEALLPGGPYDLWRKGENARFVKDLVGAFAATARLPKMLNRKAIEETLLQGCERGDFVLRTTRSDKSIRTFWRKRPDSIALEDSSLELVLSDAAVLSEIDETLLSPGVLPHLWDDKVISLADIEAYFSGEKSVSVDKGDYSEDMQIPKATQEAIRIAVEQAVKSGNIWLVSGTIGILGDDIPPGFLNERAELRRPPKPLSPADLLPEKLASGWNGKETDAFLLHNTISAQAGKPLPWSLVKNALNDAFRLGLLERLPDSGVWPCDLGGAGAIKIKMVDGVGEKPPSPAAGKIAMSELETHEVQDLSDRIDQIRELTAGHPLRIKVTVELGESEAVDPEVVNRINDILEDIKSGWRMN